MDRDTVKTITSCLFLAGDLLRRSAVSEPNCYGDGEAGLVTAWFHMVAVMGDTTL